MTISIADVSRIFKFLGAKTTDSCYSNTIYQAADMFCYTFK
jgi:hypothetical protein